MIRNYLKTAFRNLKRNKVYAFINVAGLTIGIAACLLIFLVIQFQSSFDNFHSKKKNIYRVASKFETADGVDFSGGVPFPTGKGLRLDFPQLKEVANIFKSGDDQVTVFSDNVANKKFNERDFFFAEPEFFTMFDFTWLYGDAKTSLSAANNVVLTKEVAEKYFGDWRSAIGKTIMRNNSKDELMKVTGILNTIPANTDFPLGIVASYASLQNTNMKRNLEDWVSTSSGACCFVVLPDELSAGKFNADLSAFAKKHKPAEYAKDSYTAQPLNELHFDDRFGNYRRHTFSKSLITALSLIGLFLLVIACVNFINLATAQAVNRSKEVGVRKVLGSNRRQLAFQFIYETGLITIVSLLIAVGIAQLVLPFLNQLLESQMPLNIFSNSTVLVFLIAVAILVTFLSGSYPAIILSGFNPITALKSRISNRMVGGISLRRALVVLQFAIAQVLIIGTLIVVSQMNFFRNASLGFDKASIVNVSFPGDSISAAKIDFVRNELLQNPDIKNASFSLSTPTAESSWQSDFKFDNAAKSTDFSANLKWADADYFKTYNLQFVAGRPYFPSDTIREFVVNETLLKKVGVTDPKQAIGKQLSFWDNAKSGQIVGVVKDFNSFSLRDPMAPVVLSTWKDVYQTINLKIKPGREKAALAFVEQLWDKTFPDYVYQYKFLDETIDNFYKQENQLSQLYSIFAIIAIFISCLGLYGLVSFMAAQRTKEMGIRKVLGATASNVVYLLSKEFSLLILVAFLIAAPVAYYIMKQWLQDYTYRINIGLSFFLFAVVGSVIIAWLTVGYRAIKAANANPVKALRSE